MVITPKPSWNNELVSMLSLLEFITPARHRAPDGAKPDPFSVPWGYTLRKADMLDVTRQKNNFKRLSYMQEIT